MIKISVDWVDGKKMENLIRYISDNTIYGQAQQEVRVLGHHVADKMREVIETERINPARPDHKLENAIICEVINSVGGIEVGIGRIATLVAEAKHFELINDGGTYVTEKTHFVPTTYFAGRGSMGYGDGVIFAAGSSHTIRGIDYVGKSIRNLDQELKIVMENLGAKFIGGAYRSCV